MSRERNERLLLAGRDDGMTRGARRAFVFLVALTLLMVAASLFYTTAQVHSLERTIRASCAFAADIGTAPVSTATAGKPARPVKPSRLGVSIVADSRMQWRELGCPGQLGPPQPSFVRWARYYHLPDR